MHKTFPAVIQAHLKFIIMAPYNGKGIPPVKYGYYLFILPHCQII